MRIFTTLKNNKQLLTGPKETSELFLTEILLIYSLFPVAIHYLIPPDSNIREKNMYVSIKAHVYIEKWSKSKLQMKKFVGFKMPDLITCVATHGTWHKT